MRYDWMAWLHDRDAPVLLLSLMQAVDKPRQNRIYVHADLIRLYPLPSCMDVKGHNSPPWTVSHLYTGAETQSVYFRTSVKDALTRFAVEAPDTTLGDAPPPGRGLAGKRRPRAEGERLDSHCFLPGPGIVAPENQHRQAATRGGERC